MTAPRTRRSQTPHARTLTKEEVAAWLDRHVRADITPLITAVGIAAAFTDLGRLVGGMYLDAERGAPRKRTSRGQPDVQTGQRIYLVSEHCAELLAAHGGNVAAYEGLQLWLRPGSEPIENDRLIHTLIGTESRPESQL